jgi:hypothetical protein
VKTHLSHIFTKLDTANRTELAAAAIDRGLPAGGRSYGSDQPCPLPPLRYRSRLSCEQMAPIRRIRRGR